MIGYGHAPESFKSLVAARLRIEAEHDLAAVVEAVRSYDRLPEETKARLDACLFGEGFVVSGKRVPPRNVQRVYQEAMSVL